MRSYWTLPGFEDVYLEDSWVLGIAQEVDSLTFTVDVVLRETHPSYQPPVEGEQYCYRRGRILFEKIRALSWTEPPALPAVDAMGESDFGSFDVFEVSDGAYVIAGDFGRLEVHSQEPTLELVE
ncbi:hypothetical protein J7E25_13820 [Agromyces sp. ISL-38]|uniref:hypothetical protein n=1 Tax=Agromyces sp. ISL-38 TaxID=2819107 RepID=UPI001BEB8F41|nr:hypothetical protein [Agromyces sp. ISL-38]MBT2500166.1 hypothetical protein [Agromyces sp. ISL-38]